jgi:hypothetical protein
VNQLPFLGGRAREEIESLLTAHGMRHVHSDPLHDLVAAQAQRMIDEGLERRTHRATSSGATSRLASSRIGDLRP